MLFKSVLELSHGIPRGQLGGLTFLPAPPLPFPLPPWPDSSGSLLAQEGGKPYMMLSASSCYPASLTGKTGGDPPGDTPFHSPTSAIKFYVLMVTALLILWSFHIALPTGHL